jgi:hypothetical protein
MFDNPLITSYLTLRLVVIACFRQLSCRIANVLAPWGYGFVDLLQCGTEDVRCMADAQPLIGCTISHYLILERLGGDSRGNS